ncbi:MAG: hypothetical protein ACYDCK_11265 [Thermoplasmatota archaeon]
MNRLRFLVWLERAWLVTLAGLAAVGRVSTLSSTKPLLLFLCSMGALVLSAVFILLPTRRPRTLRTVESIVLGAIIIAVMGDQFGLYAHIPYYDKALHLFIPLAVTYALFALSQSTRWVWSWTRVHPFEVGLYVFSITLMLGVFWEFFEFFADLYLGTSQQGGPHGANFDTMTDLLADALGALVGSVAVASATAYGRAHGFGTVAETSHHLASRLRAARRRSSRTRRAEARAERRDAAERRDVQ